MPDDIPALESYTAFLSVSIVYVYVYALHEKKGPMP